jgi:hypothetical protein
LINSFPVITSPIFGFLKTVTSIIPKVSKNPIAAGVNFVPFFKAISPSFICSPLERIFSLSFTGLFNCN